MKPVLGQNKLDKDTIEEAVKAEDAAKLIEDQLMRDEEAAWPATAEMPWTKRVIRSIKKFFS